MFVDDDVELNVGFSDDVDTGRTLMIGGKTASASASAPRFGSSFASLDLTAVVKEVEEPGKESNVRLRRKIGIVGIEILASVHGTGYFSQGIQSVEQFS